MTANPNPTTTGSSPSESREYGDSVGIALRVAIVSLTLATAYIHFTLGSLLFLANAAGYAVLAVAMVAAFRPPCPEPLAQSVRRCLASQRQRSSAGR